MTKYISNGVRLGWLINSQNKQVEIYQPGKEREILENINSIADDDVLPGLVLELNTVWE